MPNKYTIVTEVTQDPSVPAESLERGIHVMCDVLTVEPSGAITVWKKVDDFRSVMMQAFGPHEWKRIDYNGWEDDVVTAKTEPAPAVQT